MGQVDRSRGRRIPAFPGFVAGSISSVVCALLAARRGWETRRHPERKQDVRFGAGPRGSRALALAAKARAALRGEAAAEIDDVRDLAPASHGRWGRPTASSVIT